MMILRDYQQDLAEKGIAILKELGILYLAMEVRTGKTATALTIAHLGGYKKVLFTTKKKAVKGILNDFEQLGYPFDLTVTNNESLHKVVGQFDLVISDEHHRMGGAFPKPSKVAKLFKERFSHLPMVFLSGTPTPEGYSQIYHQFWVSSRSPFSQYSNFYKWAKEFVKVYSVDYGYGSVNSYEKAIKSKIDPFVAPYFLYYSQKEAGFESVVEENVLICKMQKSTHELIDKLKKDRVLQGKEEVILADTAVKLMTKVHQIASGTIKFESGNAKTLDANKAVYIANYFEGQKIAIFYKFKQELECLKEVYGNRLCTDLETFNSTDKNIALQIVSGREGISLSAAKYLVYYNIDFSALSYWQSRDRLTTMNRPSNQVFWVFSDAGIEQDIYKTVLKKKDFTTHDFRRSLSA